MNAYENEKFQRQDDLNQFLRDKYDYYKDAFSTPDKMGPALFNSIFYRIVRMPLGMLWGISDGYLTSWTMFVKNTNSGHFVFGGISQLLAAFLWTPINTIPLTILSIFKTRDENIKIFSDIRQAIASSHQLELVTAKKDFYPGVKVSESQKFEDMIWPEFSKDLGHHPGKVN